MRTGSIACSGLLLALALAADAHGASYCVETGSELQVALDAAQASSADDEVRLVRGTFSAAQTFLYVSSNPGWLYVTGDWDPGCLARGSDASTTVLDGLHQHQVIALAFMVFAEAPIGPRLAIENLTVSNGLGEGVTRGGGVSMSGHTAGGTAQTELFLDNVIVRDSSGYFGGGADLGASRGLLRVSNSLFVGNSAPTSAFAHLAVGVSSTEASNGLGVILANNTFVDGSCANQGDRGCGVGVNLPTGMRGEIVNNVFHHNDAGDLNLERAGTSPGGVVFLDFNRVGRISGNLAPTVVNAVTGEPRFVDANARDYRLRGNSPLIDMALGVVPIYNVNAFDLDGNPRVRNGVPDIGAYENQVVLFADGFE